MEGRVDCSILKGDLQLTLTICRITFVAQGLFHKSSEHPEGDLPLFICRITLWHKDCSLSAQVSCPRSGRKKRGGVGREGGGGSDQVALQ